MCLKGKCITLAKIIYAFLYILLNNEHRGKRIPLEFKSLSVLLYIFPFIETLFEFNPEALPG